MQYRGGHRRLCQWLYRGSTRWKPDWIEEFGRAAHYLSLHNVQFQPSLNEDAPPQSAGHPISRLV